MLVASLTLLASGGLFAQSADQNSGQNDVSALKTQMQKMQKDYEDRISAMEAEMKSLESKADTGSILNTRILTDADGKEVSAGRAGELWLRRPQSVYRIDAARGRIEFLYKCVGRGTKGLATLKKGDMLNLVGPLGVGFHLDPSWRNIVVLGRGVGLATLAPISQLAAGYGVGVTAILSARSRDLVMADDLFAKVGTVVPVLDIDRSSDVENVERILDGLIAADCADAFFTCGSNRLMQLMKRLARQHGIPGQVAMEQVMACGLGPCYVCVRTFDVNGRKELRRVCIEGPVFDLQEAVGW